MAFLNIVCLALTFATLVHSRALSAIPSCATGASFEVYHDDPYMKTLHSIMGSKDNVPNIAACAQLCLSAKGCKCAWYPNIGGSCMWRATACSTSELFINNTPTRARTGLVSVCESAPVKTSSVATVPTWGTCGGTNGSKCCGPNDNCVEKNQWYAQCQPKGHPIEDGWTGEILNAAC